MSLISINDIRDMSYMFSKCSKLHYLNLTQFNTSKCENFDNIFEDCNDLTLLVDEKKCENLISVIKEYDGVKIETIN